MHPTVLLFPWVAIRRHSPERRACRGPFRRGIIILAHPSSLAPGWSYGVTPPIPRGPAAGPLLRGMSVTIHPAPAPSWTRLGVGGLGLSPHRLRACTSSHPLATASTDPFRRGFLVVRVLPLSPLGDHAASPIPDGPAAGLRVVGCLILMHPSFPPLDGRAVSPAPEATACPTRTWDVRPAHPACSPGCYHVPAPTRPGVHGAPGPSFLDYLCRWSRCLRDTTRLSCPPSGVDTLRTLFPGGGVSPVTSS